MTTTNGRRDPSSRPRLNQEDTSSVVDLLAKLARLLAGGATCQLSLRLPDGRAVKVSCGYLVRPRHAIVGPPRAPKPRRQPVPAGEPSKTVKACAADVLRVLKRAGRRMQIREVVVALRDDDRCPPWRPHRVAAACAWLVRERRLTKSSRGDERGAGYGLPQWTGQTPETLSPLTDAEAAVLLALSGLDEPSLAGLACAAEVPQDDAFTATLDALQRRGLVEPVGADRIRLASQQGGACRD